MTETPDHSDIDNFPDGRTAAEYDRDYRKLIGSWEICGLHDPETERSLGYPPFQIWGYFEGHPFLPPGEHAHTSPVLQVDPSWTWARCASRVYRLGEPVEKHVKRLADKAFRDWLYD